MIQEQIKFEYLSEDMLLLREIYAFHQLHQRWPSHEEILSDYVEKKLCPNIEEAKIAKSRAEDKLGNIPEDGDPILMTVTQTTDGRNYMTWGIREKHLGLAKAVFDNTESIIGHVQIIEPPVSLNIKTLKELSAELLLLREMHLFHQSHQRWPTRGEMVEAFDRVHEGEDNRQLVSLCEDMLMDQGALDDDNATLEDGRNTHVYSICKHFTKFTEVIIELTKDLPVK